MSGGLELSRCAVHTRTNKPWSLAECCAAYAEAGIGGVSVWTDAVDALGVETAARVVRDHGLRVPAYVRGGFFVAADETGRRAAVETNKRLMDEAAALGAEMIVLVVGAVPGVALHDARRMVAEGLGALLPHARSLGVRLAIEPLHPMYAADKSCVCRLTDARLICEELDDAFVGVAVDAYHVWWDAELESEIRRLGTRGRIFGFHVCDWRVETRHMLTDRGLMGDGVIDLKGLRAMVEGAGFDGMVEVEVFSEQYWSMNQGEYLGLIVERLRTST